MKSANQLYSDKAVDKISIHTYLAKERIKDFNLVNGEWSCKSMPSIFIDESRSKQMKNKEILNTNIQRGKELIESVTNPEVKKGMKEALSQLQSSLEKVQRQGHYKIFCVNGNTGFRNESRIFYFIHLQNEEAYERKESSSA